MIHGMWLLFMWHTLESVLSCKKWDKTTPVKYGNIISFKILSLIAIVPDFNSETKLRKSAKFYANFKSEKKFRKSAWFYADFKSEKIFR